MCRAWGLQIRATWGSYRDYKGLYKNIQGLGLRVTQGLYRGSMGILEAIWVLCKGYVGLR